VTPGRRPPLGHPPPPPLLTRAALRLLLRRDDRRAVANDLHELYARHLARDGEEAARAWLGRQWAHYPRRLLADRLRCAFGRRRPENDPRTAGSRGAGEILGGVAADVRYSIRSLARTPVLTVTVFLTVGIGLGASTLVFSVVDATLVRPLPYPDPDRLVRIYTDAPPNRWPFSLVDYNALDEEQTTFQEVAGYQNLMMTFAGDGAAERLPGKAVTPGYFSVLGVTPEIGRTFVADDGVLGQPRVVVVSHGFWTERLGGDMSVVGRPVRLNGTAFTVVGVLPSRVGPFEAGREFFIAAQWEPPTRKGPFFITALGRLRRGATPDEARTELRAINRRLFPLWRSSYQDERASWDLVDLKTYAAGDRGPSLLLALGAVGLLLLIATTNATNLVVARVASRRRELAVRCALGASRARLLQYHLVEGALLTVGCAGLGLALAASGVGLLRALATGYLPRSGEIALAGSVPWFLAAVTAAAGLLFGTVPALYGARLDADDALRAGGRTATDGAGPRRLRRGLVAAQFAVATPLLVVAGLLALSLTALQRVDLGVGTRRVLTGSVYLPQAPYPDQGAVETFWDQVRVRVAALPGVETVAFGDGRPPAGVENINNFDLEDQPTPPGQNQPVAPFLSVSPAFFDAFGITLDQGRPFDERDARGDAPPVVIVDRAWADRFYPGQAVVGRRLREGGNTTGPWISVVGVVGAVKYVGLDRPDQGTIYAPMAHDQRFRFLVIRTTTDPASVLPAVRQALRSVDPTVPLSDAATIDDLAAEALDVPRSLAWLVGIFAVVALLLSVMGVYGVTAFFVQQRAKDIGIRIALGGEPRRVAGLVVAQGLSVVTLGVLVGLGGAALLARLVEGLLFGVEATDVTTFAGTALALVAVAVAACLVPARRAAAIDPVVALREE